MLSRIYPNQQHSCRCTLQNIEMIGKGWFETNCILDQLIHISAHNSTPPPLYRNILGFWAVVVEIGVLLVSRGVGWICNDTRTPTPTPPNTSLGLPIEKSWDLSPMLLYIPKIRLSPLYIEVHSLSLFSERIDRYIVYTHIDRYIDSYAKQLTWACLIIVQGPTRPPAKYFNAIQKNIKRLIY